jgi:hypothetical protein
MHVVLHSYSDNQHTAWIQTSVFYDNGTLGWPTRHYEALSYGKIISENEDDYSIVIGTKHKIYDVGQYSFLLDDLVVIQGGTIETEQSSILF